MHVMELQTPSCENDDGHGGIAYIDHIRLSLQMILDANPTVSSYIVSIMTLS